MKKILYITVMLLMVVVAYGQNCVRMTIDGGSVNYGSIAAAVAAANEHSGAVLTLIDGCEVENDDDIVVKSDMTIDLNGNEIYGFYKRLMTISGSKAHLTIRDSRGGGQITLESDSVAYCLYVQDKGAVTLENGLINCEMENGAKENYHYGIYAKGSSKVTMNGGTVKVHDKSNMYGIYSTGSTVTINGGTIEVSSSRRSAHALYAASGTATVNGGTLKSTFGYNGTAVYLGSSVTATINDGRFMSKSENGTMQCINGLGTVEKVKILGGVFSHEMNIEKYTGDKVLVVLDKESANYKAGYRLTLAAARDMSVARNIVKGISYNTLEEALNSAVKGDTVVLNNDYTLTQNVTVKDGVVLHLPHDLLYTWSGEKPLSVFYTAHNEVSPYLYRTLTIADGVTLTVEGELNVSAMQLSSNGGSTACCGIPTGPYALIRMQGASVIDVKGKMLCWGYVAGSGAVKIQPKATLYEAFIIADHRGGTRSEDLEKKGVYPFNQCYVQNIEVPVTYYCGATEIVATNMVFELENMDYINDVTYIGNGDKGLFQMCSGSTIVRRYDAATDRMTYDINGNVVLGSMAIGFDSKYYSFPINSYMTLRVNGNMQLLYDYTLMPGARLEVAEGAKVTISEGKKLMLFDRQDWGNYGITGYVLPLAYTVANGNDNRSVRWGGTDGFSAAAKERLMSSAIDVKGTMAVKGNIMTSQHGADITTTGDGTIYIYKGGEAEPQTMWFEEKIAVDYREVPVYGMSLDRPGNIALMGDMNNDRRLSMTDANILVNALLRGDTPAQADITADGIIDRNDVEMIFHFYLTR
ncbi:MAG: hypothetical protein KBT34_08075 [Prevotella sp.]|nr:hypothetical protein [Candidatus Prevotella equi]